jgi:hypothetical protein
MGSRCELPQRRPHYAPGRQPVRHAREASLAPALPVEEGALKLAELLGREAGLLEDLDGLVGQSHLLGRQGRRIPAPAEPGADVLVEPCARVWELVRQSVKLAHLLEQRLELLFVDRHEGQQGNRQSASQGEKSGGAA